MIEDIIKKLEELYSLESLLKDMSEKERNQLIGKIELLREIRSIEKDGLDD